MGLYVGNQRYTPVIRSDTQIYRGSFNIITDLGLTIDATEQQIAAVLATEVLNPGIANYCFVDVPFEYYTEVSGYDSFSSTSDYVGYYVVYNDVYTLVTNDNKDSVGITAGTTIAYNINYRDYFKYVYRFKYNGSAWVYEYDTDFSGCANVDADNFTEDGTTLLSGLAMPSGRFETLTVGASGSAYTAPANGWFVLRFVPTVAASTADNAVSIRTSNNFRSKAVITTVMVNKTSWLSLPILKNNIMTFQLHQSETLSDSNLYFIYAEGNPTPPTP